MNKQKICIIGGSLTGLVTAISLSKLNCEIDLVMDNNKKITKSNRTVAISQSNLDFLSKLEISKSLKNDFWPSEIMKLYTENENKKFSELFHLDNIKKEKKILYMIENSKLLKNMKNKVINTKNITLIKNKKVNKIENIGLLKSVKFGRNYFKYNLIIVCTGANSDLSKNIFPNESIENSYEETSVTTILKHDSCKNNVVRQIFLDNAILALLPISKDKTSIVLSIKKNEKQNKIFFKKKIKFYSKKYIKNIKFSSNVEFKNLNFLIREKYFNDRILLFGDALHLIHPFVGQGFNMVIRDLISLRKILSKKISLGLDIGSSDILSEFSTVTKSNNFVFSIGVDILKNYFSTKNPYFKEIRNNLFKVLNKNNFVKDIFINVADKGLRL